MPEWMFLTKHAMVLSLIAMHRCITAREMATAIGTTERQVRRVIANLSSAGYIGKRRAGRGVKYWINPDLSLRYNTHQEIAVGDFLEALGWKRRARRPRVEQEVKT